MLSNLSNNRVVALASVAAICMMAGIARGEDGGGEDHMIPAAYFVGNNGHAGSDPVSCKELREEAWLNHELGRSDGDAAPSAPAVGCRPEVLAEFSIANAD